MLKLSTHLFDTIKLHLICSKNIYLKQCRNVVLNSDLKFYSVLKLIIAGSTVFRLNYVSVLKS